MTKQKIIISLTLLVLFTNISIAGSIKNIKDCENVFKEKQYNKIILNCINLSGESNDILTYKTVAQLLDKVSLKKIDQIFDYGDATPIYSQLVYNKKLYSNIEKHYLKKAYGNLKRHTNTKFEFVDLLYAKVAYINVVYFQYRESKVINSSTIKKKEDFITNEYIPHLKRYIQKYPKDKEVLYLLGKTRQKIGSLLILFFGQKQRQFPHDVPSYLFSRLSMKALCLHLMPFF